MFSTVSYIHLSDAENCECPVLVCDCFLDFEQWPGERVHKSSFSYIHYWPMGADQWSLAKKCRKRSILWSAFKWWWKQLEILEDVLMFFFFNQLIISRWERFRRTSYWISTFFVSIFGKGICQITARRFGRFLVGWISTHRDRSGGTEGWQ